VWIGPIAPDRHDASQCIIETLPKKTPWIGNGKIPLNPGLVAIIGARGSGKTALADILAIGSNVYSPLDLATSFIHRASRPIELLADAEVHITWGDGAIVSNWVSQRSGDGVELVRYLSQQFVEQLCSATGLAIGLRKEIERVIFDATDPEGRLTAGNFEELANIRLLPIRRQRDTATVEIASISNQVNAEESLHASIPSIKKETAERQKRIEKNTNEMKTLVPKGKEERAKRLADLDAALNVVNGNIEKLNRAKLRVDDLRQEVGNLRLTHFPNQLIELKSTFEEAGLTEPQWEEFEIMFKGNVDTALDQRDESIIKQIRELTDGVSGKLIDFSKNSYGEWPQQNLISERDKVKAEVGIDGQKQLRYNHLQIQLNNEQKAQQKAATDLQLAEGAAERRKVLIAKRKLLYVQILQTFLDEQAVLEQIYEPLQKTLEGASGSLKRLRLAVSREVDVNAWVRAGEELLDLRRESRLRGHGALEEHTRRLLLTAWRSGTADQVGVAMQNFITELYPEIRKSMPTEISPEGEAAWTQRVATWLYSTSHFQLRYCVTYDGVAIEHLSAGTRGIVLLLLYLVIDRQDRRPLIIDQPEESLDPKSVFDELVPHFREARKRRQVIIVTHNANLVVNTDADQVIVASSNPNAAGGLPTVNYRCGSLEDPQIRTMVCEILEGGEQAFRDRERRYRIQRETRVDA
jgi:AAA domain, putative AbiEii toxin, Type IV TA system